MVESMGWNWELAEKDFWNTASADVYYYASRWLKLGFKKFLDLGCGLGRHSIFFAEHGFQVEAFDLSQSGIDRFKEKIRGQELNIKIMLGDMLSLPYEDDFFDCILGYHSIYHTDTPGINKVVSEIFRVLRAGGEALLTFNSKSNPSFTMNIDKQIDENTVLKYEECEMEVPHFYTNLAELAILLKDFIIVGIRHIEDIWEGNHSWHYFVHVKKV